MYLNKTKKVPETAIAEEYTPFHHQDYQTIVGKIKSFAAAGDAAVINTINGDSNVAFFKELANQGLTADKCPVMSFSFAEVELQTLDVKPLVGPSGVVELLHVAQDPREHQVGEGLQGLGEEAEHPRQAGGDRRPDDARLHPREAVGQGCVTRPRAPRSTRCSRPSRGSTSMSPVGKYKVDEKNHHTWKPVYIGKIREDGQFDIVWRSKGWVAPSRGAV